MNPFEIVVAFYNKRGNRIGSATAIVAHAMSMGHTTTLKLKMDEPVDLMSAQEVRVEIVPLSPLEFLIKASEHLDETLRK